MYYVIDAPLIAQQHWGYCHSLWRLEVATGGGEYSIPRRRTVLVCFNSLGQDKGMYATLTSFTRHTHSSHMSLNVPSQLPSSLVGLTISIEVFIGYCEAPNRRICNAHMTCHMMRTQDASFP